MKRLTQPWFLIFLFIISIYTYQFYKNPDLVQFSMNQAQASHQADNKEDVAKKIQELKVDLEQSFKASQIKNINLSAYQDFDLRFEKTNGDQIVLRLEGAGTGYKNKGTEFKDWFIVNLKKGSLNISSHEQKDSKSNMSFKDLAKKIVGSESKHSGLHFVVQFPKGHSFEKVKIEVVSADTKVNDLSFGVFEVATVSGDLNMEGASGDTLKLESVSGDNKIEMVQLKKASFKSVSGDTTLTAKNSQPKLVFESVSGDFNLNMPSDSELEVKFESMSGDLKNEFGLSKKASATLDFSSLSGDAEVKKML